MFRSGTGAWELVSIIDYSCRMRDGAVSSKFGRGKERKAEGKLAIETPQSRVFPLSLSHLLHAHGRSLKRLAGWWRVASGGGAFGSAGECDFLGDGTIRRSRLKLPRRRIRPMLSVATYHDRGNQGTPASIRIGSPRRNEHLMNLRRWTPKFSTYITCPTPPCSYPLACSFSQQGRLNAFA